VHAVIGLALVAAHHVELARREGEVDRRHRGHVGPAGQRDVAHLPSHQTALRHRAATMWRMTLQTVVL